MGGQAGGLKQPARKRPVVAQLPGLFGEDDKDRLGDFLGVVRVADLAQGDGIDQIDMARDQGGKGLVRMIFGVLAQQRGFIHDFHLAISVRRTAKGDKLFALALFLA